MLADYAHSVAPFWDQAQQAMEIRRTALGERHPDYAQSLNNLALLYDSMGRQAEAEELRKKAIAIHRRPEGNGLQPGQ